MGWCKHAICIASTTAIDKMFLFQHLGSGTVWHSVAPAFQLSQDIKNQQHIDQKQNVEIFAEF